MTRDMQVYLSTHPGTDEQTTANQGFNINNGDVTRWKWVRTHVFACYFRVDHLNSVCFRSLRITRVKKEYQTCGLHLG